MMDPKDIPDEWTTAGLAAGYAFNDEFWSASTTRAILAGAYPRIKAKVREDIAKMVEAREPGQPSSDRLYQSWTFNPERKAECHAIAALIRKGPVHD